MFTPAENKMRASGRERQAAHGSRPKPFRPPRDARFRPSSYAEARREGVKPWFPLCLLFALAGLIAQPGHAEQPEPVVVSQQAMLARYVDEIISPDRTSAPAASTNNLLARGSRADGRLQLPLTAVPARPLRLPGWLFILLALGLLTYSRIDGARG